MFLYLYYISFRKLAKDNMPFMSLEIHGLQEIQIDPNLPHSDNMKNRLDQVLRD